jgi:Ca-activated chloride channel family protein
MKHLLIGLLLLLPLPTMAQQKEKLSDELRGLSLYEKRHYEAAAQALHNDYRRGVALYKAGRYAEAASAFQRAAETESHTFPALYNWGNSQFQQQDYQGAIHAYTAALAIKPDDADTLHNLELAKKMLRQSSQGSGGGGGKPEQGEGQPGGGGTDGQPQDGREQQDESNRSDEPGTPDDAGQSKPSPGKQEGEEKNPGNQPQQGELQDKETPAKPSDYIMNQLSTNPADLAKRRIQMEEMNNRKAQRESMKLNPW